MTNKLWTENKNEKYQEYRFSEDKYTLVQFLQNRSKTGKKKSLSNHHGIGRFRQTTVLTSHRFWESSSKSVCCP